MNRHKLLVVAGILLVGAALAMLPACGPTPTPTPTPPPIPSVPPLMELGINSLNDPRHLNGNVSDATAIGAVRDRWAVEWFWVEQPWRDAPWGAGEFNWQGTFPPLRHPEYDPEHPENGGHPPTAPISFDIDGIPSEAELPPLVALHGIPRLYDCTYWSQEQYPDYPEATSRCAGDSERIEGLFEPALQGDEANPDNKWARFVFKTVNHLVQEKGIGTYQIWNEPDQQWLNGGPLNTEDEFEDDYVQMVEVAGEAAEQAGGDTLVLGAPSSNEDLYKPGGWVHTAWGDLTESAVDRLDAIAIHSYDWPFQTWSIAERARGLINDKPIWVTESGLALCDVPACGGYCTRDPEQQASYVLQQFAYARVAGIAVDYHFRMYDDPRAFGLRPAPGGAERLAATAARLATQYLSDATLVITDSVMPTAGTRDAFRSFVNTNTHTRLVFESSDGEKRITVLWANTEENRNISVPRWSSATYAELLDQSDAQIQEWQIAPESYPIHLEGARPLSQARKQEEGCTIDNGNDPVLKDLNVPAVGGPTYILIESREGSRAPTGGGSLIWSAHNCIARPDRTYVWGYDEDSGLDHVTVECSPATEYDLRWTTPGRIYAGVVRAVPPEGATCTLTLYDRAGNFKQQTLHNPGPKRIPGCDHPDDTYSAASVDLSSVEFLALPGSARAAPRVAILDSGFAGNMLMLLFDLGEPAVLIESDFDPVATVAQYPVLLIPSGGLYGLEHSASFRARLEEYARLGGTIVAFAQQHGYEYGALPGGQVGGYGWAEDISCFDASLYLSEWHPLLSGLDRATLNVHVDGYFTAVPTGTQVLLSRRANGMPAAVLYPFPPGGGTAYAST